MKLKFRWRRFWGVMMIVGCLTSVMRADVAVLREKGPKSGGLFANIGPVADYSPAELVVMKSADVSLHLRRGDGDTLVAECEATFVLEDQRPQSASEQEFLVAFPVTGLRSAAVSVETFEVWVDGKKPPAVFRRAIEVSRRDWKSTDSKIHGQMDAKFGPKKADGWWASAFVKLGENGYYRAAYAWTMSTTAAKQVSVKVAYKVTLKAQPVAYTKSYRSDPGDEDTIAFADLEIEDWTVPYYFFDYVLVSGATWHGPIGRETIKLTWDSELGLDDRLIVVGPRWPRKPRVEQEELRMAGVFHVPEITHGTGLITHALAGKPEHDLLFAIPRSAIAPRTK